MTTIRQTAQDKLDAAIRARSKKLKKEFEARVRDEAKRRIDKTILPYWRERIEKAQELYNRRKGLMDKETFNSIRRALHPDSRNSISDKKLGEAFDTFMGLKKFVLIEKDSPTDLPSMPRTWDEWEDAKRKASAERKARRTTGKSAVRTQ